MDGILIIDKPPGPTSHDIVDFIRRRFKIKKVGHAGTLDPQATGVLVVLVGSFTKKSRVFACGDKAYEARLTLGVATDTEDAQGEILQRQEIGHLDLQQINAVFRRFLGKSEQIPPMFSALSIRGKRLYAMARQGLEVRRRPRPIYIFKLELTKFDPPHIYFTLKCSKGTYVRTLCVDIARNLGYPGHLSQLRRISSGCFAISQAVTLDRLSSFSAQELKEALINESY